jgi:hypothetical protein
MKVKWKKIAIMPENWARGYINNLISRQIAVAAVDSPGGYFERLLSVYIQDDRWDSGIEELLEYCEEFELNYQNIVQV